MPEPVAGRPTFPDTLVLEDHARLSLNYLRGNMDPREDGLPFFLTFLEDPVEARHLGADYGDVTARSLEATVEMQELTGTRSNAAELATLQHLALSFFSESDGLAYRPATPWSGHDAMIFDQGRMLRALLTWYMRDGLPEVRGRIEALVAGLTRIAEKLPGYWRMPFRAHPPTGWDPDYSGGVYARGKGDPTYDGGSLVVPLIRYFELTGYEPALALAEGLNLWVLAPETTPFSLDGSFGWHLHSRMAAVNGVLRYAQLRGRDDLVNWAGRVFAFADGIGTSFGWSPELADRVEGCETCCTMDMLEAAILLARGGAPEYWGWVERAVRNHLIESQLQDVSWLRQTRRRPDTRASWFDPSLPARMVGAFAGNSLPNDFIGPPHGASTLSPMRLRHCCGPAGAHALYLAWQAAVERPDDGRCTRVNLLLNRDTPWARVDSELPYQPQVRVMLRTDGDLAIRVPDWAGRHDLSVRPGVMSTGAVAAEQPQVSLNGSLVERSGLLEHGYIVLRGLAAGDEVQVRFFAEELPVFEQRHSVGGHDYSTWWRGDTVVAIWPMGTVLPLYRRSHLTGDLAPPRQDDARHCGTGSVRW